VGSSRYRREDGHEYDEREVSPYGMEDRVADDLTANSRSIFLKLAQMLSRKKHLDKHRLFPDGEWLVVM
jgi:hypothetical protein